MPEAKRPWSDQRVEGIMGNLLRSGVIAAASVVLAGGVSYLISNGDQVSAYRFFRGEPPDFRAMSRIVEAAFALNSRGVIQFGLLLLILTPVTRVAFSIVAFALQRDWMYVIFTFIVFTVLMYSLMRGQF